MNHKFFWGIFSLLLIGCSSTPRVFNTDATYRQKPVLRLKVKTVDTVNSYVAPEKSPYVDHLMPYSLAEFLTEWAHHRLSACATKGFAVVTIEQASISQKALPINKGFMDTFTRFPSSVFEAVAEVRIDFMDFKGYPQGYATAKTRQSLKMLEKTSISEQNILLQNLGKKVTDAIDQEIEKSLRQHAKTVLIS